MADTYSIQIGGGISPALIKGMDGLAGKVVGISGALGKLGGLLGASLSVAGLVSVTREGINAADSMGKLAQKAGVAVETLSRLSLAATLSDVDQGGLQTALKSLATNLRNSGDFGRSLGLSGGSRDVNSALREIAEKFAAMPDGIEKTALAVKLFGRAGQDMIPMLNDGAAGLDAMTKEAEDLGITISTNTSKQAEEFNDNLTRVGQGAKGVGIQIANVLLPSLVPLSEYLVDMTKDVVSATKSLVELLKPALEFIAYTSIAAATGIQKIGAAIGYTAQAAMQAASGDFSGAAETMRALETEQARLMAQMEERQSRVFGVSSAELDRRKPDKTGVPADREALLRAELDAQATRLAGLDPKMSALDRAYTQRQILQAQKSIIGDLQKLAEKRIQSKEDKDAGLIPTTEELRAQGEYNDLLRQQYKLQADLTALDESTTFTGRFSAGIRQLSDEWSNFGANFANVSLGAISSAIDGVSEGIMGMINGTKTWGQVFMQMGAQILQSLIKIAIQALVVKLILAPLGLGGILGFQSGGFVGPALPGMASGGYTGSGSVSAPAGIVHGGEFVVPAGPTAEFGVPFFEGIRQGRITPDSIAGGSRGGTIKLGVLRTRQDMREFMAEEGAQQIFNEFGQRSNRFTI